MFKAKQKVMSLLVTIVTVLATTLLAFSTLVGMPTKSVSAEDHRFCQITSQMDLCARRWCTLSRGFASNLCLSQNG